MEEQHEVTLEACIVKRIFDHTYILEPMSSAHAQQPAREIIKMAKEQGDNSLYPIAVLIDELRNDDVNVSQKRVRVGRGSKASRSLKGVM